MHLTIWNRLQQKYHHANAIKVSWVERTNGLHFYICIYLYKYIYMRLLFLELLNSNLAQICVCEFSHFNWNEENFSEWKHTGRVHFPSWFDVSVTLWACVCASFFSQFEIFDARFKVSQHHNVICYTNKTPCAVCLFFLSLFQFYSLAFLLFFLFDLVLIADIKHIPLHLHHPNTRLITVWRFVAIHFIKLHNLNEANRKWRKYSVQLIVWLLNGPSDFLEMCFFLYFYFIFAFDFGFFRCCFRCWCWCLFLVAVILTLNRHNFRKAGDFKRIESCTAANGWMYAMRSNVKLCDLNWNRHKMF